ncbi:hypothetical protein D9C73_001968 [Collichthys lucidus]|uniref:Uncharacterized protein n=1 Tax=Collichthys lucidus TaxID=240159 RepID=A0A4U5TYX6_COLLU|nr:hypothetical protein D9C73_001968 [Collichthys lucidus]
MQRQTSVTPPEEIVTVVTMNRKKVSGPPTDTVHRPESTERIGPQSTERIGPQSTERIGPQSTERITC